MKNPRGLRGYTTRITMRKQMAYIYFFSDDFGLRSPVIQKTFLQTEEKRSYLYRGAALDRH